MSRRDDTLKCLLKKDYKDIKFLKDDGEWCYYQVRTFGSGKHNVRVKDGLFGCTIEKV
ncbi:hypothetical protein ACUW92_002372 [Staphylococcus epidermidis]|uniref:hypothetical protein n=1 Tax=Staphylococcus epidermidis TaxID=1282 RepID=UPI0015CC78DF|nr:hypothetical protein [Staphylococcus epidermidis]MCG7828917.1 hypothetical protein [Staphylococcus epidermidis]MCM3102443.1 hypothetical protein [Staphylococcus epidermidis]